MHQRHEGAYHGVGNREATLLRRVRAYRIVIDALYADIPCIMLAEGFIFFLASIFVPVFHALFALAALLVAPSFRILSVSSFSF